jgi:hypothetical protein
MRHKLPRRDPIMKDRSEEVCRFSYCLSDSGHASPCRMAAEGAGTNADIIATIQVLTVIDADGAQRAVQDISPQQGSWILGWSRWRELSFSDVILSPRDSPLSRLNGDIGNYALQECR